MRTTMFFLIIVFFLKFSSSNVANATSAICEDWFKSVKISKNCLSECLIAPINMSNYLCHNECESLCEQLNNTSTFYVLTKYGITEEEIYLCESNKLSCIKAYTQTWEADKICLKIFHKSKTNDESDACRHFTWSILLAKSFGIDFAEKILNAHENNPKEPADERAMDLSNNRLGLIAFQKADKNKKWSDEEIIELFNSNLKENKFVILKPSKKFIGGSP